MTIIKIIIAITFAFALFLGNLFYRIYFVPEVISDVAISQMDRANGDAPAIGIRAYTELSDWGAFFSSIFFLAVVLVMFSPEITKAIKAQKQGAPPCGDTGHSESPSSPSAPDSPDA